MLTNDIEQYLFIYFILSPFYFVKSCKKKKNENA